jgi:hypothetical protein
MIPVSFRVNEGEILGFLLYDIFVFVNFSAVVEVERLFLKNKILKKNLINLVQKS